LRPGAAAVCPITAITPLGETERDHGVAINRHPAAILSAKSKKISASIQNDAFFSSLLGLFLHESRSAGKQFWEISDVRDSGFKSRRPRA